MLHVLRSKTNIMGTCSVAFGFKNYTDAQVCVQHMRQMGPMVKIWYTAIKPDKFVLTTSPHRKEDSLKNNTLDMFEIQTVDTNDLLREMLDNNISVRIIDDISIDHEITTLHSESGYETMISHDHAISILEKNLQI